MLVTGAYAASSRSFSNLALESAADPSSNGPSEPSGIIDSSLPGNRLREVDGKIVLPEKSFSWVVGECVLRPLIDTVARVGSSLFNFMRAGYERATKIPTQILSLRSESAPFVISEKTLASTMWGGQVIAVSRLSNQSLVVAWNSQQDTNPSGLSMRIISSEGIPPTGELIINANLYQSVTPSYPLSAHSGNTTFLTYPLPNPSNQYAYQAMSGQIVTSQGAVKQSAQYTPTTNGLYQPSSISSRPDGNIFVWGISPSSGFGDCQVQLGVISPSGSVVTNWNTLYTSCQASQMASTSLSTGNTLAVWHDDVVLNDAILGCIGTPSATALPGCGFSINQPLTLSPGLIYSTTNPLLTMLPDGNVFVTWQLKIYNGASGSPYQAWYLQSRVLTPTGKPVNDQSIVNATSYSSQLSSTAPLPNGEIFSVFTNGTNVYGMRLNQKGEFLCAPTQINQDSIRPQITPTVTALSDQVLVTWISLDELQAGRVMGQLLPYDFCSSSPESGGVSSKTLAIILGSSFGAAILISGAVCYWIYKVKPKSQYLILGNTAGNA